MNKTILGLAFCSMWAAVLGMSFDDSILLPINPKIQACRAQHSLLCARGDRSIEHATTADHFLVRNLAMFYVLAMEEYVLLDRARPHVNTRIFASLARTFFAAWHGANIQKVMDESGLDGWMSCVDEQFASTYKHDVTDDLGCTIYMPPFVAGKFMFSGQELSVTSEERSLWAFCRAPSAMRCYAGLPGAQLPPRHPVHP